VILGSKTHLTKDSGHVTTSSLQSLYSLAFSIWDRLLMYCAANSTRNDSKNSSLPRVPSLFKIFNMSRQASVMNSCFKFVGWYSTNVSPILKSYRQLPTGTWKLILFCSRHGVKLSSRDAHANSDLESKVTSSLPRCCSMGVQPR